MIDAVLVDKLDRLSRTVAQLSVIVEACHRAGVELHDLDFGKDENTPMGRMIRYFDRFLTSSKSR